MSLEFLASDEVERKIKNFLNTSQTGREPDALVITSYVFTSEDTQVLLCAPFKLYWSALDGSK